MTDPTTLVTLSGFVLTGLCLTSAAALKGWQSWLDIKRVEIAGNPGRPLAAPVAARIELADLKERVRRLEAIASGVDL